MRQVPHTRPVRIQDFQRKKNKRQPITVLTCYDAPSAKILANTSLDCILVGDSVAMAVHGYQDTLCADVEMMVLHTQAVKRGLGHQFLVTDMPFLSYRITLPETMHHVQKIVQAGAHAVKLEGGDIATCETIAHITTAGIPVMGHLGLTAQSIHQQGGYRIQGREEAAAAQLIAQAKALEQAGCFAIVLECIPYALAQTITEALSIPTIGIGAGNGTDGQVLVWHDVLGLDPSFQPKFTKQYANLAHTIENAIHAYCEEVATLTFPAQEHTYA